MASAHIGRRIVIICPDGVVQYKQGRSTFQVGGKADDEGMEAISVQTE